MKISKNRLKEIIRQELKELSFSSIPGVSDCPSGDDVAGIASAQGEGKEHLREKIAKLKWIQENC